MFYKFLWAARAIFYKPFLGKYLLPSYIGKPLIISNPKKIFIGKKVRIFPGARIEVSDKSSSIHFGNNISIGQNLHIISGCSQQLLIGDNTTISANVFISNIEHEYQIIDQHIMTQPLKGKETIIKENCFIGFGAVIQAGTKLGKQCIIGSNSVVRGTFPDHCVIVGAPAKIVKRFDSKSKQWVKTDSNGNFINEL